MFERADAGVCTYVPLTAAIHRQPCDLVARAIAQCATESGAVAQHHVYVGRRAVNHNVTTQRAGVSNELNAAGRHAAAIGKYGITDPQEPAATVACNDIAAIDGQRVVAALQPERGTAGSLDVAVVDDGTVPIRSKRGQVGAVADAVAAGHADIQAVCLGKQRRVHVHDAGSVLPVTQDRDVVEQCACGGATDKHTAAAISADVDHAVDGFDAAGATASGACHEYAIGRVAMRGDPAALQRSKATTDLHAVAVDVRPCINGAIAQLQPRLVAGKPEPGVSFAHLEPGIVSGQHSPSVDVYAIAADGMKAAAVDHSDGVGFAEVVAQQTHGSTNRMCFNVL